MALFNISVLAHLNLPESVRRALVQGAADQGRIATALEAIVTKINEAASEVPPELSAEIAEAAKDAEALKQEQQGA
ncbi:MAG TPA: hypothetical protein VJ816_08260 [Gemmatimonadales bacterium]|nr:hypothetical protein [Gemmatimonadales bacterium]